MVRLINEYIQFNESKEDQERFINKFGEESFDNFQKFKQRIKNKGYSPDLTFHVKNTSVDDMKKILDGVSDKSREQEVDIEGKQIPKDTKNYKIIDKTSEWTIYQPLDYVASIYCANSARWCTAGGYDVPEGKVKVSQAKHYFNEYTDKGVELYYCINSKSVRNSIAVAVYPNKANVEYFNYNDDKINTTRIPKSLYDILQNYEIMPPKFVIENGILVKYTDSETNAVIPDGVTSIGFKAFYDCTSLTSITIPDSITSIGGSAFYDCTSLTSITIPDSVTSIGDRAFYDCISLTSVTIPDSVTSIGSYAFYDCKSLKSITIPDSVVDIGDFAFTWCRALTNVTISNSVTSIGWNVFRGCSSLESIKISNNITSIGSGVFENCTSLTSITIPNNVTYIDEGAFDGCNSLTVHTKNQYVIDYCKENGIEYDNNINEGVSRNIFKLRIRESIENSLYLYHATDKENLDSIMKSGLLINPPKHNWEGMYTDGGIFLALDASVAEDYADNSDNPPDEIVILKVKLSSLDNNSFGYDWNNRCEYHDDINSCVYYKNIPSNLLSVCNVNTESSQDFDDFEGTELYEILYQVFDEEVETNKETNDYWLY